jgi:hypothetical protein
MNGNLRMWQLGDAQISLPKPLFLVVEDVGWWLGEDGSSRNEPYRTSFCRRHCLEDYRALLRLAERLRMRIAVGMVLGEWDRTDFLRQVPGSTWMGAAWDNQANRGPQLEEVAAFLHDNRGFLEIALHGLCHEFWREGRMERTEFHDPDCRMRRPEVVKSHLHAFGVLLEQNNLGGYPRLFIPPGLYHSFGDGDRSMQAILHDFGVDLVTTRFSRARRYQPPIHERLTWECGVGLLERGVSPVAWNVPAAMPVWDDPGPIMALHWSNLLHPDPQRNGEIVDGWVEMLLRQTAGPERILARDAAACWRQSAVSELALCRSDGRSLCMDLRAIPNLECFKGSFHLKISGCGKRAWQCVGGELGVEEKGEDDSVTLSVLPEKGAETVTLLQIRDP